MTLSTIQKRAAELLSLGHPNAYIEAAINLRTPTLEKWSEEDEFKQFIELLLNHSIALPSEDAGFVSKLATIKISSLLDHPDPEVKIKAFKEINSYQKTLGKKSKSE